MEGTTALSQCTALNVSDEVRCEERATSVNGLFCGFHSKQCQGLYRGYKLRNSRLDRLDANSPRCLVGKSLANLDFADVDTEETCREIHDHLFLKYQLLERVIRARKLHHSRFFSMNNDYGHEKFLDALQGQKAAVLKALERLGHRAAEVLYKNKEWFTWVRRCQDEEEQHRDKEQKKVKQEAAMFKRHWKATQQRTKDLRAREDKKKQDAYLEKVYKERMAEKETDDDDMDWDPIEDVLEDGRGNFVDLIRQFLWMSVPQDVDMLDTPGNVESKAGETPAPVPTTEESPFQSKSAKKKKKKGGKSIPNPAGPQISEKPLVETKQEMHDRLKHGAEYNHEKVLGVLYGTVDNPVLHTKTVTFQDQEAQKLLEEISEIKLLLFCRLLLGHAALLPAALQASSVEEFLADEEVTAAGLRDLCLKMENPGLQEIRDACADLFRPEEAEDNGPGTSMDRKEEAKDNFDLMMMDAQKKRGELPEKWISKREKRLEKGKQKQIGAPDITLDALLGSGAEGQAVDFGETKDGKGSRKKIRVKVCGRTIWNYPSSKAMNRGGWLHFCIIAKDSSLFDAVSLCRHWDEFFELNILALHHYFPGADWGEWCGTRFQQQLLTMGFIMYFHTVDPDAERLTVRNQVGGRYGPVRRAHSIFEARNFICAHIKRDDPASRRLVQYLSMQTHRLLLLVRDAESGRILIKPPEDEKWLWREKSGLGRPSNKGWNTLKIIGPQFFEQMDTHRRWHFSFKEYYDIYVWDLLPGEPFAQTFNCVQECLLRAHRCRTGPDIYNAAAPVLKTLVRDKSSPRPRDILPGEEGVTSIYDEINGPETEFFYLTAQFDQLDRVSAMPGQTSRRENAPKGFFYSDADALEDQVLFPEETETLDPLSIGKIEPLQTWAEEGYSMKKFIQGQDLWDSDDETTDDDEGLGDDNDEENVEEYENEDYDEEEMSDDGEGTYITAEERAADERDANAELPPSNLLLDMTRKAPGISRELGELLKRLVLKKANKPEADEDELRSPHDDYMRYLDKEKSRIFKQVWHKADLEPDAQQHYVEMVKMEKQSRKFNERRIKTLGTLLNFQILDWLDVEQGDDAKDLHKAIGKIAPFFSSDFAESEEGQDFQDSLIFKQEQRAKQIPNIRSHVSNKYRPNETWKEFEDLTPSIKDMYDFPAEWDISTRPIIAHLYKSGVLRTRADEYFGGLAIAAKEPGRPKYDFFLDYRERIPTITMSRMLEDPHKVTPLLAQAQKFAKTNPTACFAVLRLWSAPHFYPLMIGPDNHDPTSFVDLTGRRFIWMFIPKDMPCSEFSFHKVVKDRIMPYKKHFGDSVVVKRDKVLVMGTDEKYLSKLTTATTFALQKRPWLREVDLWKSFINVDLNFLEKLDNRWWE